MKRWKTGLSLNSQGWGLVVSRLGHSEQFGRVQRGDWRSDEPGSRGIELRQICLEHKLTSPITVAVTVEEALWTIMELPLVPDKDIPAAIRSSWEELHAGGEWFIAHTVLKRAERLQVSVGAVPSNALNRWMELLEAAGVQPEGIVLQAQAVCHSLLQSKEPTLFVLATPTVLEIGVACQGIPALLRTMAWAEGDMEGIGQELGFTRHAWVRQGGAPPQRLLALSAPTRVLPDSQAEVWKGENLQDTGANRCLEDHLSLIAAYGAAQTDSTSLVWHLTSSATERRKRMQMFTYIAASLLLFGLGIFFFHQAQIRQAKEESHWVQSNLTLYRELERMEEQDERMLSSISRSQQLWENRMVYSQGIDHWQEIVPPMTVLNHWMMEEKRVVEISGRTPSIARLLERLAGDKCFRGLSLKGAVYRNPKGWDEFRLAGVLAEEVSHGRKMGSGE